jgi:hypothetical protein
MPRPQIWHNEESRTTQKVKRLLGNSALKRENAPLNQTIFVFVFAISLLGCFLSTKKSSLLRQFYTIHH